MARTDRGNGLTAFHVLHVIGGSEFGGIVPYVASLVKMAREHGGSASVLATAPRIVSYYQEREIEVVQIRGIDRPVNPLRDIAGLRRLVRYLRVTRPTIVHTHTSKGGVIGRLAAHRAGVPITIHTTQGYAFTDYASTVLSRSMFFWAEKAATKWCDFIIAANETDRLKAVESGIVAASKIVTIPNSIDLAEADAALRDGASIADELRLDPARPTVGVMARLATQKGIDVFIDAVPAIASAVPEAQFLIVGSGELEQELRARALATGIGDRILFAGHRTDWYRVLKLMDVFVMPSRWEGMPITLLGAMAAGRAIVATRIKGIMDVCEGADVAILVPPDDSHALAGAITTLLRDRDRAVALGQRARVHLESHFSDRVMNERTWAVYESVASTKGLVLGR